MVGVQVLGNRDEPDATSFKLLDIVQAIHQGAPEPVQLPHEQAIEFPCRGILHQPVEPRPAGLGTAHDVLVRLGDLPPLAGSVFLKVAELKVGF